MAQGFWRVLGSVEGLNFYKLYIGDYQRDTAHLSLVEHGAYMLMLQHYYATEKPLPTGKALYRMLRAESKIERDAIDWIVAQFWEVIDGGLMNKRAAIEIAKAARQRSINQELGKRGGRPKKTESVLENETEHETESVSEREPIDNPNHSQTPENTKKTTTRAQRCRAPLPPDFEKFWDLYPKKRSKGEAEKAWLSLRPDEQLTAKMLAAVERAKTLDDWKKEGGKYVPHPATWLRAKGWEDELLPASVAAPASDLSWLFSDRATEAKGREVGLSPRPGESWDEFRRRIQVEEKRREVA